MLTTLVALDLAAALTGGPITLTPGKQLGPVELGMTAAEVTRLGAVEKDGELTLGRIAITLRKGRVSELTGNFAFADKQQFQVGPSRFQLEFQPDGGHTGDELVKLFTGCKKPYRSGEDRLWRVWRCQGVRVDERLADGDPEITITVQKAAR